MEKINVSKSVQIVEAIKAGGATQESLRTLIGAPNKKALYSQLSLLNSRGMIIAEVVPEKAEFPLKGEDGVYYMGTLEQFTESRTPKKERKPRKAISVKAMLAHAEKRLAKAVVHKESAAKRAQEVDAPEILKIRSCIAALSAELAEHMLDAVKSGDYSSERYAVDPNAVDADNSSGDFEPDTAEQPE